MKGSPPDALALRDAVDAAAKQVAAGVWRWIAVGLSESTIRGVIEREARIAVHEILLRDAEMQRAQVAALKESVPADALPPERITYRAREACEILGISHSKLYDLISQRRLPARKLDGVLLIRRIDIQEFIDNCPEARPDNEGQKKKRPRGRRQRPDNGA